MELTNNDRFDLAALLKIGSLDPRHSAEAKPSLKLKEYYSMLTALLNLAPDVSRSLTTFERKDADRDDRRWLNQLINLLETIGCEAFIVESHSILDAYEITGNWRLAGTQARKMKDNFSEFCSQIERARKKSSDVGQTEPGEAERADTDEALLLKDAIRFLGEKTAEGKKVILAVDDSPAILQSVWAILNDTYQVLVLAKPEELEKVLQKQKPDLFLLDYMMPGLSGFELVPVIRSYKEHKDTPIIFLTSDGSLDNVTSAIALGASDFIVKPFKPEILREKINKQIT